MRPIRPVLSAMGLVVVATLFVVPPAHATGTVQGTVTITGDAVTPVNGYVEFADPDTPGNWNGVNLTNGAFSRPGMADDTYLVRARVATMDGTLAYYDGTPDGSPNEADAVPVVVEGSEVTLSFELSPIARLSGTLTNADGDPMPGVGIGRNRQGMGDSRVTDASGDFSFGYVRAGLINITVGAQDPWGPTQEWVTVPANGLIDLDLVLPRAGAVAGTITDAGTTAPAAYVEVMAFRRSDSAYLGSDLTDATGGFGIEGLGAQDFSLRYADNLGGYHPVWNGGALDMSAAAPLNALPGQTLTHDEALTQRPDPRTDTDTMSGVVSAAGGGPLAGIEVRALGMDQSEYRTVSDRSGRWALSGLPDGDYHLVFRQDFWLDQYAPEVVPWFPELYPDAWTKAEATVVTVAGGDHHPGLDVALGRAARIRIPVTGPGGTTDLNAGYRLVDSDTGATVVNHPPTAFEGASLALLARPGSYQILVSGRRGGTANAPQLLSQWYGGGVSAAGAPVVSLAALDDVAGSAVSLPAKLRAVTAPKVKGAPKVGRRLRVTTGAWNLMTDTRFSYRWLRGTKVVGRAAAYRVKAVDAGKRLTVKVNARNGALVTPVTLKVTVRGR
jgi:hypothetical protein